MKPKLEYGSHGQSVSEAQAKLNVLLPNVMPALTLDGKYGAKSVQRVKVFQKNCGLVADGIVGAKTWAALDGTPIPKASGKPAPPAPSPKNPLLVSKRVHSGATLACSCGIAASTLKVTEASRQDAVVRDCKPYTNVMPFGMCQSCQNPTVFAAMEAAQGVLTPMPCQPVLIGQWSAGVPIQTAGKPPSPLLDMNSVLQCAWGGLVRVVNAGK